MAILDGSLIIRRTKYIHLRAEDAWDFRHTGILLKVVCPFFPSRVVKFNFQIPIVERRGAQPQMSESRVLDLFELGD